MEVKINVDESMFKDVLEGELAALSSEQVQEVLLSAIKEYFTIDNYKNLEKLLYTKESRYYSSERIIASPFTKGIIEKCDYSKLQEVVDVSIEHLKTNSDHILKDILLESIMNGLTNTYQFKNDIRHVLSEIKYEDSMAGQV